MVVRKIIGRKVTTPEGKKGEVVGVSKDGKYYLVVVGYDPIGREITRWYRKEDLKLVGKFDSLPFGQIGAERKLEAEVRRDVERIFEEKRRRLGVEARLDLHVETVEAPPIVGENVYGEAFPFEKPPRVWLEVFPEATTREITRTVCEELLHVKHPGLSEGEIAKMVPECAKGEWRGWDILRRTGYNPPPGPITACEARWSDEPNLLYPHSVVQLRPQAFLDLCPPLPYTHEGLKSMVADVVGELETKGRYKPFLKVNLSGRVLDHEGRIRAIAAARLGCREIPVEVYFYDEEHREFVEPPEKLPPLAPQRWWEFYIRRGEPVPPTHAFHVAGLTVRVLGPPERSIDIGGS